MITSLPHKLNLPNFPVSIGFEEAKEHEFFGKIFAHEYKVILADKNANFNNYLYLSFLCYIIGSVYDLNISDNKAYPLGAYLYHVFSYNDIVTACMVKHKLNFKSFRPYKIKVPTFGNLTVSYHDNADAPLGSAKISDCAITMYSECKAALKDVILIHELVEFANSIYRLKFNHTTIQTFAEVLTYVIKNNRGFIS